MLDKKVKIFRKLKGPIVIEGPVELTDMEGNLINHKNKFSLCGCGKSLKMPFCDGAHKTLI
ncbi:MAG: CDGSH iron-sulfur domain-containing protein [Flavobacteriaceae bacterium]|nr:CDGSH iron-sulfur domain-containing protein [Flavobacteriaceae bacterium]MCY4268142.1 CDGSH iron-sulfur domain-containing protein [Flavobacteriaceae bacterium]MCY4298966.1 CDGSH iron-sulfur domain-containing protein [Flavobacteriaceae bacterium]